VIDHCASCHSTGDLQAATLYDTSGGTYLQLCQWCRGVFERRRDIYQPTVCVRCNCHSDPRRADGLQFFDASNDEGLHVCDDCRVELLEMTGGSPPVGVGRCQS